MNYGIKMINPIGDGKDYYMKSLRGFQIDLVSLKADLQEEFFPLSTNVAFVDLLIGLINYGLDYAVLYNMAEDTAISERIVFLTEQIGFENELIANLQAELDALGG